MYEKIIKTPLTCKRGNCEVNPIFNWVSPNEKNKNLKFKMPIHILLKIVAIIITITEIHISLSSTLHCSSLDHCHLKAGF